MREPASDDHPKYHNENSEECRIDDTQEKLTESYLLFSVPLHPALVSLVVPESLDVRLEDDVHEGLGEAEDEPAVDHLDVGRGGEVGADTEGVK